MLPIDKQLTHYEIYQVAAEINFNPTGVRNLDMLDRLRLRDLFKNYYDLGSRNANVNIDRIIEQIGSGNVVKRVVNTVKNIFRPDVTSQEIIDIAFVVKRKAGIAYVDEMTKSSGSSSGTSTSKSTTLSIPYEDPLEKRKILRENAVKSVARNLDNPELDKMKLMAECKREFEDFAGRIVTAGKKFQVMPQTNSPELYTPHNPHEAGNLHRNFMASSTKLQGQEKIDYVNKIEEAYGDLCIALSKILNPPAIQNTPQTDTQKKPLRNIQPRQTLTEKRMEARNLIEEFHYGQALYDMFFMPTYKVKKQDTWEGIAEMFEAPVESLKRDNNLRSAKIPPIGETLQITKDLELYDVQPNDTWKSIARNNNTEVALLKRINGLGKDSPVPIGGLLRIPPPNFN